MKATYITRQGDMVDAIAKRFYGFESGSTEAILNANRGLADQPAILPENLTIIIPDLPTSPATRPTVNLWD